MSRCLHHQDLHDKWLLQINGNLLDQGSQKNASHQPMRRTDSADKLGLWVDPYKDPACSCAAQVEGAFVMGMGVLGTEQVDYDSETGKLIQDSTWTYKIPSATCVPQQLNVAFLEVRLRRQILAAVSASTAVSLQSIEWKKVAGPRPKFPWPCDPKCPELCFWGCSTME